MVLCASTGHGWVSFGVFWGGLRLYSVIKNAQKKRALFCTEEMGVLLESFDGVTEKRRGVVWLERRRPPSGSKR